MPKPKLNETSHVEALVQDNLALRSKVIELLLGIELLKEQVAVIENRPRSAAARQGRLASRKAGRSARIKPHDLQL